MAGITPAAGNTMVMVAMAVADDQTISSASATNPATFAKSAEKTSTGGADCAVSVWYALQGAAAATGTISWNQPTNSQSASYAFVLLPAVAASGGRFLAFFVR